MWSSAWSQSRKMSSSEFVFPFVLFQEWLILRLAKITCCFVFNVLLLMQTPQAVWNKLRPVFDVRDGIDENTRLFLQALLMGSNTCFNQIKEFTLSHRSVTAFIKDWPVAMDTNFKYENVKLIVHISSPYVSKVAFSFRKKFSAKFFHPSSESFYNAHLESWQLH